MSIPCTKEEQFPKAWMEDILLAAIETTPMANAVACPFWQIFHNERQQLAPHNIPTSRCADTVERQFDKPVEHRRSATDDGDDLWTYNSHHKRAIRLAWYTYTIVGTIHEYHETLPWSQYPRHITSKDLFIEFLRGGRNNHSIPIHPCSLQPSLFSGYSWDVLEAEIGSSEGEVVPDLSNIAS